MPRKLALDLQQIYIDYVRFCLRKRPRPDYPADRPSCRDDSSSQLWQLVPLLHPPTHLQALDAGFDRESAEFLTVVLAVATYTTALAPNSWVDVPPAELYGFLIGCVEALQSRIEGMVAVSDEVMGE